MEKEAYEISKSGLKHILILTGDAPKIATIDYLKKCTKILLKYFTSVSIEIYALKTSEYKELIDCGVDSLTLYQETYNEEIYEKIHSKGPKKDYRFRLDAPERSCIAGIRTVNTGALLGLSDWQKEIFLTALHTKYLQDKYSDVDVSVSLPRMRPFTGNYEPKVVVTDKNIVQIIGALRLFMPRAGITISTRENEKFRNNVLKLGVTKMSAGSNTSVGGHSKDDNETRQFDISDNRNVSEMAESIMKSGYQPVYKDWQPI